MNCNDFGKELIKSYEALKLNAYDDGSGNLTIGWGHTTDNFFTVKKDSIIDLPKAIAIFENDLKEAESIVNLCFNKDILLSENQFSALTSIAFNSGFFKSKGVPTHLMDAINQGNLQKAAQLIPEYKCSAFNKETGRYDILLGLKRRRMAEQSLFVLEQTALSPGDWVKNTKDYIYKTVKK